MKNALVGLALLVAVGLGYGIGKLPRQQPETGASQAQAAPARARQAPVETRDSATLPAAEITRRLARQPLSQRKASVTAMVDRMGQDELREIASGMGGGRYSWEPESRNPESLLNSAVYEKWAETDPEGLIAFGLEQTSALRYRALDAAFANMVRLDPAAALARMDRLDPDNRDKVRETVVIGLAESDPARALAMAEESQGMAGEYILAKVFATWMRADANGALGAFAAMPKGRARTTCLNTVTSEMVAKDPDAALAWAQALAAPEERRASMKNIVSDLTSRDPEKALGLLCENKTLADGETFSSGGISEVVDAFARLDYAKAKQAVLALTNPAQRVAALAALSNSGRKNHADDLLALAASLPAAEAKALYLTGDAWWSDVGALAKWSDLVPDGPLRQEAKARLVNQLAWSDPEEAARQFALLKPGMAAASGMAEEISRRWGSSDPGKAFEWAASLTNPAERKGAVASAMSAMAEADPAAAAAKLLTLDDPGIRSEATAAIADSWCKQDPESALTWAKALSGDQKTAALRAIAQAQVKSDPDAARKVVALMVSSLPAGEWQKSENQQMASAMAGEFAETDPGAAASFAATLPAGDAQNAAYSQLVGNWACYAPNEAESWLGQLPEGDVRDHAAGSFAESVSGYDPEKAYEWAITIGDQVQRRKAAEDALSSWKNQGGADQARKSLLEAGVFTEQEIKELGKALD